MDQKRTRGMSEAQVGQMSKVYALFSEITGVLDIRQIKQSHIAQFMDMQRQLPPTYRKSPKSFNKPLSQIIAENNGPSGLSATTINRNLDYLNQFSPKPVLKVSPMSQALISLVCASVTPPETETAGQLLRPQTCKGCSSIPSGKAVQGKSVGPR